MIDAACCGPKEFADLLCWLFRWASAQPEIGMWNGVSGAWYLEHRGTNRRLGIFPLRPRSASPNHVFRLWVAAAGWSDPTTVGVAEMPSVLNWLLTGVYIV